MCGVFNIRFHPGVHRLGKQSNVDIFQCGNLQLRLSPIPGGDVMSLWIWGSGYKIAVLHALMCK